MTKNDTLRIVHKLIDWATRRRTAGFGLLKGGVAVIVGTRLVDYAIELAFRGQAKAGADWHIKLDLGNGLPDVLTYTAYSCGILVFIAGAVLLVWEQVLEFRRQARQKLFFVELRGLHIGPDTLPYDDVLPEVKGLRQLIPVNFRPQKKDDRVDPDLMLERIRGIRANLEAFTSSVAPQDVSVVVGGLAAVPALFYAGALFEDESRVHVIDWERDLKAWMPIDGSDDGDRFLPATGLDQAGDFSEVVLAVSASYPIEDRDVASTFKGAMPVVQLRMAEPRPNKFWSLEKQQESTSTFRDTIVALKNRGAKRVHLILAAQASLAIRFGMSYCGRNMPEVLVYQYESSVVPPFPWALRVPNDRDPQAAILRAS